jgi:hypothetical protein
MSKWPTKPLEQVLVSVNDVLMMAIPQRPYFDAEAVNEAVMKEQKEKEELRVKHNFYKMAFPHCEKHTPKGGSRAGCLICAMQELHATLSKIDYLCGPPNEMGVSAYDVHYDPEGVFESVKKLAAAHDHQRHLVGTFMREAERLQKENVDLQAQIDAIMLEYCPAEMTREQLQNWANAQIAFREPK